MPTIKPDLSRCQKIILLRTDRIGDMLVTTPCIRALRQYLPNARIDMVASPLNAVVLHRNPHLDQTHIFDRHKPWTVPGLIWRLRTQKYDASITFNSISGSASWLTHWVGTPDKIGINGPPQRGKNIYTWLPKGGPNPHAILSMLYKMESLGVPPTSPHMDFVIPEDVAMVMRQRFPKVPGRLRLTIFLGNIKKIHNRWPVEKYRELTLGLLEQEKDLDIVLLAGLLDRPLLETFADVDHPRLDRFVGTTLEETGGFLQSCHAMLAGSSGPTHLAGALNVPVLAILSKDNARIWQTLGKKDVCVTPDTEIQDTRGVRLETVAAMVQNFLHAERLEAKAHLS